jgi:hypothetical protein
MDWTRRLAQPDRRSCGAAVLVVARMLHDPAYADLVEDRFADEVLDTHRRTTGPVDAAGALQLPWPRALGTPPWAVARQMTATSGVRYRSRVVRPWRRQAELDRIVRAAADGHPVPVYVGSRRLPRHVVLVLDEELRVYEPSAGRRVRMRVGDFVDGELELASWSRPWFSVLPR